MARIPKPRPSLPVLGWREWVGLPGLGVPAVKAKLDTGARSSAIHAFDIRTFRRRGRRWVRFGVHPLQRDNELVLACEAEVVDERRVVSSMGTSQKRLVIVTDVAVGGAVWPIEVTLASRDQMGFRMLLGRQALAHRFVVDSGRSFLGSPGVKRHRRRRSP